MVPDDIYGWTVNDGPVPSGFSVWVARRIESQLRSCPRDASPFPRWSWTDARSHSRSFAAASDSWM